MNPTSSKSWLTGKDSDTGRDWGRRKRGWQRMRWLFGITNSSLSELWEMGWTGRPGWVLFMGSPRVGHDWATELNWTAAWKKRYDKSKQHIEKQTHSFANRGPSSQSYGFSSSHVRMWELDQKESWASKNWCFWTIVLEKTIVSPLDYKEIEPVRPKGNQSWIFTGRTDVEIPILEPPDVKNWLIWKDPDSGKDWRQQVKGTTENEMVGWHHWLEGHEFG